MSKDPILSQGLDWEKLFRSYPELDDYPYTFEYVSSRNELMEYNEENRLALVVTFFFSTLRDNLIIDLKSPECLNRFEHKINNFVDKYKDHKDSFEELKIIFDFVEKFKNQPIKNLLSILGFKKELAIPVWTQQNREICSKISFLVEMASTHDVYDLRIDNDPVEFFSSKLADGIWQKWKYNLKERDLYQDGFNEIFSLIHENTNTCKSLKKKFGKFLQKVTL